MRGATWLTVKDQTHPKYVWINHKGRIRSCGQSILVYDQEHWLNFTIEDYEIKKLVRNMVRRHGDHGQPGANDDREF